jgi:hypothetical protein
MPIPNYIRQATKGLFLTGLIFVGLPPVIRFFDPAAGSFGFELLNALGVAAMLFSTVLHLALYAYEKFLPAFHEYQGESLEGEKKLFENLTGPLETSLAEVAATPSVMKLEVQVETRKTAQFKFLIRCVRISFCLLSLGYLLHLAMQALTLAMTAVPGAAPAL